MKLECAGILRQPFRTRETPLVLVPYAAQEAVVGFLDATRHYDRGLGLFHGPPQSGKTSIIRHFSASLADDYAVALVDGTGMEAAALLQRILGQFGYDLDLDSASERFNMIRVFATQQAASGGAPLLIVENTHSMSPVSLEILCELADLSIDGKSALRMILVGDRRMLPLVRAPAMQSISSRMTGQFLLHPMTRSETTHYIHRKLASGGCKKPQTVFPPQVCDRLYTVSGGWPGKIDRLAVLALLQTDRCPVRIGHVPGHLQVVDPLDGITTLGKPTSKHSPADARACEPHLILSCRDRTLKRVVLNSKRLLVGRDESNDLTVVGEWISRQHAVFFRNGYTTIVVDLKSKNGTYVNGKRIVHQVLINNDIIAIGGHRIRFIDPAARRRTSLRRAGWDETTIVQTVLKLRRRVGF